jgi:hypothetical protein
MAASSATRDLIRLAASVKYWLTAETSSDAVPGASLARARARCAWPACPHCPFPSNARGDSPSPKPDRAAQDAAPRQALSTSRGPKLASRLRASE